MNEDEMLEEGIPEDDGLPADLDEVTSEEPVEEGMPEEGTGSEVTLSAMDIPEEVIEGDIVTFTVVSNDGESINLSYSGKA